MIDDIGLGEAMRVALAFLFTLGALCITGFVLVVVGAWKRNLPAIAGGIGCGVVAVYYGLTIHTISRSGVEILPPLIVLAAAGVGIMIASAWRRNWWTIGGGTLCVGAFVLGLSGLTGVF